MPRTKARPSSSSYSSSSQHLVSTPRFRLSCSSSSSLGHALPQRERDFERASIADCGASPLRPLQCLHPVGEKEKEEEEESEDIRCTVDTGGVSSLSFLSPRRHETQEKERSHEDAEKEEEEGKKNKKRKEGESSLSILQGEESKEETAGVEEEKQRRRSERTTRREGGCIRNSRGQTKEEEEREILSVKCEEIESLRDVKEDKDLSEASKEAQGKENTRVSIHRHLDRNRPSPGHPPTLLSSLSSPSSSSSSSSSIPLSIDKIKRSLSSAKFISQIIEGILSSQSSSPSLPSSSSSLSSSSTQGKTVSSSSSSIEEKHVIRRSSAIYRTPPHCLSSFSPSRTTARGGGQLGGEKEEEGEFLFAWDVPGFLFLLPSRDNGEDEEEKEKRDDKREKAEEEEDVQEEEWMTGEKDEEEEDRGYKGEERKKRRRRQYGVYETAGEVKRERRRLSEGVEIKQERKGNGEEEEKCEREEEEEREGLWGLNSRSKRMYLYDTNALYGVYFSMADGHKDEGSYRVNISLYTDSSSSCQNGERDGCVCIATRSCIDLKRDVSPPLPDAVLPPLLRLIQPFHSSSPPLLLAAARIISTPSSSSPSLSSRRRESIEGEEAEDVDEEDEKKRRSLQGKQVKRENSTDGVEEEEEEEKKEKETKEEEGKLEKESDEEEEVEVIEKKRFLKEIEKKRRRLSFQEEEKKKSRECTVRLLFVLPKGQGRERRRYTAGSTEAFRDLFHWYKIWRIGCHVSIREDFEKQQLLKHTRRHLSSLPSSSSSSSSLSSCHYPPLIPAGMRLNGLVREAYGEHDRSIEESGVYRKTPGDRGRDDESSFLFIEPQYLYDCLGKAWNLFTEQTSIEDRHKSGDDTKATSSPCSSSRRSIPFGDLPFFPIQPPGLRCELRPYQQRAVLFALSREWRRDRGFSLSSSSVSFLDEPCGVSKEEEKEEIQVGCRGDVKRWRKSSGRGGEEERGVCTVEEENEEKSENEGGRTRRDVLKRLRKLLSRSYRYPPQTATNLIWQDILLPSGRFLAFHSLTGDYRIFSERTERREDQASMLLSPLERRRRTRYDEREGGCERDASSFSSSQSGSEGREKREGDKEEQEERLKRERIMECIYSHDRRYLEKMIVGCSKEEKERNDVKKDERRESMDLRTGKEDKEYQDEGEEHEPNPAVKNRSSRDTEGGIRRQREVGRQRREEEAQEREEEEKGEREEEEKGDREEDEKGEREEEEEKEEREEEEEEEKEEREEEEEIFCFDAPGGMLCDEMGLGKTVEAIALMLLHSHPSVEDEQETTKSSSSSLSPSSSAQSSLSSPSSSSSSSTYHTGLRVFFSEEDLLAVAGDVQFECVCGFEGMSLLDRRRRERKNGRGLSRKDSEYPDGDKEGGEEGEDGLGVTRASSYPLPAVVRFASYKASADTSTEREEREAAFPHAVSLPSSLSPLSVSKHEGLGREVTREGRRTRSNRRRTPKEGEISSHLVDSERRNEEKIDKKKEEGNDESVQNLIDRNRDRKMKTQKAKKKKKNGNSQGGPVVVLPVIQCILCRHISHVYCMGIDLKKDATDQSFFICPYCQSSSSSSSFVDEQALSLLRNTSSASPPHIFPLSSSYKCDQDDKTTSSSPLFQRQLRKDNRRRSEEGEKESRRLEALDSPPIYQRPREHDKNRELHGGTLSKGKCEISLISSSSSREPLESVSSSSSSPLSRLCVSSSSSSSPSSSGQFLSQEEEREEMRRRLQERRRPSRAEVKGNLVLCPTVILQQWIDEIKRHTRRERTRHSRNLSTSLKSSLLKVGVYPGIKHARDLLRKNILDHARRLFSSSSPTPPLVNSGRSSSLSSQFLLVDPSRRKSDLSPSSPSLLSRHASFSFSSSSQPLPLDSKQVPPNYSLPSVCMSSSSMPHSISSSLSHSRGSPDKKAHLLSPCSPPRKNGEEEEEESLKEVLYLSQADDEDALVVVRPEQFKVFDVVLVSYDTLKEEIWFSPSPSSSSCRPSTACLDTPQRLSRPFSFSSSLSSSSSSMTFQATTTTTSQAGGISCEQFLSSSFIAGEEGKESVHFRGKRYAASGTAVSFSSSSSFRGGGGLGLRREKRYRVLHSPLLQVQWWRLLIDEAQMVGGYSLAAQFARALSARYRWCISGTPLLHATSGSTGSSQTRHSSTSRNLKKNKNSQASLSPFSPSHAKRKREDEEKRKKDEGGARSGSSMVRLYSRIGYVKNLHLSKELAGLLSALKLEGSIPGVTDPSVLQQLFQPLGLGLPSSLVLSPESNAPTDPSLLASSKRLSSSSSSAFELAGSWSRRSRPSWLPGEHAWGRSSSLLYTLVDLLFPLFWRTNMKDVMTELGIPPPILHDIYVDLSPVERYFYQRQQQSVLQRTSSLLFLLPSSHSPPPLEPTLSSDLPSTHYSPQSSFSPTSNNPIPPSSSPQASHLGSSALSTAPCDSTLSLTDQTSKTSVTSERSSSSFCNDDVEIIGQRALLSSSSSSSVSSFSSPFDLVQLDALLLTLRQACQHPQLGAMGLKKSKKATASSGGRAGGDMGAMWGGSTTSIGSSNRGGRRRRGRRQGGRGEGVGGRGGEQEARRRARGEVGVAGGEFSSQFMTMSEILDKLLHEAKLQAEENLRALCAAMNGLAGLAILRGRFLSAMNLYRHVLTVAQCGVKPSSRPSSSPGTSRCSQQASLYTKATPNDLPTVTGPSSFSSLSSKQVGEKSSSETSSSSALPLSSSSSFSSSCSSFSSGSCVKAHEEDSTRASPWSRTMEWPRDTGVNLRGEGVSHLFCSQRVSIFYLERLFPGLFSLYQDEREKDHKRTEAEEEGEGRYGNLSVLGVKKLIRDQLIMSGDYHVDSLQQIHAACNLSQLLSDHLDRILSFLRRNVHDHDEEEKASQGGEGKEREEKEGLGKRRVDVEEEEDKEDERREYMLRGRHDSIRGKEKSSSSSSSREEERKAYVEDLRSELQLAQEVYRHLSSRYTQKFVHELDRAREIFRLREEAVSRHQVRRVGYLSGVYVEESNGADSRQLQNSKKKRKDLEKREEEETAGENLSGDNSQGKTERGTKGKASSEGDEEEEEKEIEEKHSTANDHSEPPPPSSSSDEEEKEEETGCRSCEGDGTEISVGAKEGKRMSPSPSFLEERKKRRKTWRETSSDGQWYMACLSLDEESQQDLVNRVSDSLADLRGGGRGPFGWLGGSTSGALRFPHFSTCAGLVASLQLHLQQLYDKREDLIQVVISLDHRGTPSEEALAAFSSCTNCNELSRPFYLSPPSRVTSEKEKKTSIGGRAEEETMNGGEEECARTSLGLTDVLGEREGEVEDVGRSTDGMARGTRMKGRGGDRGRTSTPHERRISTTSIMRGRCQHCRMMPKINALQYFLYSRVEKDVGGIGDEKGLDEGGYHHFGDSELLKVVRVLRTLFRRYFSERHVEHRRILQAADEHVKELDAIKKESMAADAYFFSSRQVLSAVDELRMSVSRFRLKTREEELAEAAARRLTGASGAAAGLSPYLVDGYAISAGEVEPMQAQLVIELGLATSALQRSHRQHRYLKNLQEEEEKKHERRKTAASSLPLPSGSEGDCRSSMQKGEDSGIDVSVVKKRQNVDSSVNGVNDEREDKELSIQTTANSSMEDLSKENVNSAERDGTEEKLIDALLEEKHEGSFQTASIEEQSEVSVSTTSSSTATTASSGIQRERKDSVHTLVSDQEKPGVNPNHGFSSSSASSAHSEQVACISAGVLEEGKQLACMREREEEEEKEAHVDPLLAVVTTERQEPEKESATREGPSIPQQSLSGSQDTSLASNQRIDKPSLQESKVAERNVPRGEDGDREDKRVCPVCFTELGENSFTAVLPCAHQLCIECSKTLRTEKVSRQRSKSASEMCLHSAVGVVSPLFQRRKHSNIVGASCSSSTSLSSSSFSTLPAARRCPVCRSPFLLSQISYLYGESLTRSREATSSDRLPPTTTTPLGTPTSKSKRKEISGGSIPIPESITSSSSSSDTQEKDNDALRVRDACSPSSSTRQLSKLPPSYCETPHKKRLRSEEGEEGKEEEKNVSYTRENKEEQGEDYAPRNRETKDVSGDGVTQGKNSENAKKRGEKEEDLKTSCSSTDVGGPVRDGERDGCPQPPSYRETTSHKSPASARRLQGGYSAKLAAVVEKVLEILRDASSSSSPLPVTPSLSHNPGRSSSYPGSPSYSSPDSVNSPSLNGVSSPPIASTKTTSSLSATMPVPTAALSSSDLDPHHSSIDSSCFPSTAPITATSPPSPSHLNLSGTKSPDEISSSRSASSLRSSSPSKILIFSEWLALLDLLQFALHRSGVEAIKYMGGSQKSESAKLRLFKTDPDTRVMLCSLQKAGRGITLTEADHVMFVEVPMNAADEEQAIGRIYRMGQCKQTHVWRFIVKDTVEERIVRMRGKKPQETAAASMLRSRSSPEGVEGSEDAAEDTQSSLLPSVALLRLGQRVTAADIAVLLGVSDFSQRDTSNKSTAVTGRQVTERKQEERSENPSLIVGQEDGRHTSEGRKEDKKVTGCGVKRGISESAGETADKKRRMDDGRHSEERQSEHEGEHAARGETRVFRTPGETSLSLHLRPLVKQPFEGHS
ncbi:snf2 family n-terminal domain-containing protein [Cystoisospora suis]|uniref:Snf2 family n-terminal domain-containing protein n=1 Tax=Cystoisospora suis TaxID=483139 RepID=A0A2C6L7K1_9APIC|nr:snf2 family n-terminal domain-containing protein [Cystoisospora suis]